MDPSQIQQFMQNNPEVLQLMQQPGMMQKMMQIMQNPAAMNQYANDPDVMRLMQAIQGGMGRQGMGAAPGFNGGRGMPQAPPVRDENVIDIHSRRELTQRMNDAGDKLVVVDFSASWCGPCQMLIPIYSRIARTWKDKAVFIRLDIDECRDIAMEFRVSSYPTIILFKAGKQVATVKGLNEAGLEAEIDRHTQPPPCPYRHFPMKFDEMLTFKPIKFDLVLQNVDKFNNTIIEQKEGVPLTPAELRHVHDLVALLDDQLRYHVSDITVDQYDALFKTLDWPEKFLPPVMNLVRVLPFHPGAAKFMVNVMRSDRDIIRKLCSIRCEFSVVPLLIFRTFCNMFSRRGLAVELASRAEEVLEAMAVHLTSEDDNVRTGFVGLGLNFAVTFGNTSSQYENAKVQLISSLCELLAVEQKAPIIYRALVCFGSLIYRDPACQAIAESLDIASSLARVTQLHPADKNIVDCSDEITQALATGN
eukprot:TRINITY_DN3943_c0_g1_i1.p1 TRINITY_DN3943_c0_g1~~TRINITY_DN3943_c0_g1_i1.p1  ORF type:complete len:476 (-),score=140.38 TRINITY_DN3943_c0_g1_i1:161-1588(-)